MKLAVVGVGVKLGTLNQLLRPHITSHVYGIWKTLPFAPGNVTFM